MGLLLSACAPRWPSASVEGFSIEAIDFESVRGNVRVAIDNPMFATLPVSALRWSLFIDDKPFASGERTDSLSLVADAVTVVSVPVLLRYDDLRSVAGTDSEVIPYRFHADIDVQTPLGLYTLPVERSGTMPRLQAPSIDLVDVGFGIDGLALRIDLTLKVGLPAGVTLSQTQWTVKVASRTLASGQATAEDGTVSMPMWFQPTDAAKATWDWYEELATSLDLSMSGALQTPLGPVPFAFERELSLRDQIP